MSRLSRDKSDAAAKAAEVAFEEMLVRASDVKVVGVCTVVVYADGTAGVAWCGAEGLAPHMGTILEHAAAGERHQVVAHAKPGSGPSNG